MILQSVIRCTHSHTVTMKAWQPNPATLNHSLTWAWMSNCKLSKVAKIRGVGWWVLIRYLPTTRPVRTNDQVSRFITNQPGLINFLRLNGAKSLQPSPPNTLDSILRRLLEEQINVHACAIRTVVMIGKHHMAK